METYEDVSFRSGDRDLEVADQEELPSNVCESIRCDLQVHDIC